jgi:hypothetical protein
MPNAIIPTLVATLNVAETTLDVDVAGPVIEIMSVYGVTFTDIER